MTTFYDKTGLPKSLAWGFIGVLIFMMGDGIEQTWLSRYIASQGLDHDRTPWKKQNICATCWRK